MLSPSVCQREREKECSVFKFARRTAAMLLAYIVLTSFHRCTVCSERLIKFRLQKHQRRTKPSLFTIDLVIFTHFAPCVSICVSVFGSIILQINIEIGDLNIKEIKYETNLSVIDPQQHSFLFF